MSKDPLAEVGLTEVRLTERMAKGVGQEMGMYEPLLIGLIIGLVFLRSSPSGQAPVLFLRRAVKRKAAF